MSKIKCIIFDMDGLMFDTGKLAYRAYLASAKVYDYEMIPDVYYYLTGRTEAGIVEAMKDIYGNENDILAWRAEMVRNKTLITETEQRVYKKAGLVELIDYAKFNKIKMVIASSSKRSVVEQYCKLEDLDHVIELIVSGDQVNHGKPDPEIFLKACGKAGVDPSQALVLEDSMVGILAANAAKIKCAWIDDDIGEMPEHKSGVQLKSKIHRDLLPKGVPTYTFKTLFEVIDLLKQEEE